MDFNTFRLEFEAAPGDRPSSKHFALLFEADDGPDTSECYTWALGYSASRGDTFLDMTEHLCTCSQVDCGDGALLRKLHQHVFVGGVGRDPPDAFKATAPLLELHVPQLKRKAAAERFEELLGPALLGDMTHQRKIVWFLKKLGFDMKIGELRQAVKNHGARRLADLVAVAQELRGILDTTRARRQGECEHSRCRCCSWLNEASAECVCCKCGARLHSDAEVQRVRDKYWEAHSM